MRGIKAQLASCSRKVAYVSPEDAVRAGRGLGSYLCPICGRYHLTSGKVASPKPATPDDKSETFDPTLLGRARLKKPRRDPPAVLTAATCLGKPRADGRVRLDVSGKEMLSEPVQPASLRFQLSRGSPVRVRLSGDRLDVVDIGSSS